MKTLCGHYWASLLLLVCVVVNAETTTPYTPQQFISEQAPLIAFTQARIIDGTGTAAKENHTLIIRDGRISKIGKDGSVSIPKGAKRISLKGKSIVPGWVMVNEHLYNSARSAVFEEEKKAAYNFARTYTLTQQPISYPRLYLAAGVTTARTLGSIDPFADLNTKKNIDAGIWIGPEFELTAPYIDGEPAELQMQALKNPDEVRAFMRYWAAQGFTSFHTYEDMTEELLAAAIDEAKQLGLPIAFHTAYHVSTWAALEMGANMVTHGFMELLWDLMPDDRVPNREDRRRKRDVFTLFKEQDKLLPLDNPKAKQRVKATMDYLIDNNVALISAINTNLRPPLPEFVIELYDESGKKDYWQYREQKDAYLKKIGQNIVNQRFRALEQAFWQAGGLLTIGTEAGQGLIAGYTNLRSIELLTEAGIPNIEAIKIASHNGAKAMAMLADRGTITEGKRADLIVMQGDPSRDIKAIYQIETVFKQGIGYDAKALNTSVKGTVRGPQ